MTRCDGPVAEEQARRGDSVASKSRVTFGVLSLSPRSITYLQLIATAVVAFHALRWLLLSGYELGGDMDAYWNAAIRLRTGEPLYPPLADLDAHDVYRYSAWWAIAWVPLTHLPKGFVEVSWVSVLYGSLALLLVPLFRQASWASLLLVLLLSAPLIQSAWYGQLQILLALVLVRGIDTRFGPAAIGIAASLKLVPILFVLTYVARREWRRVGMSLVVAALLTLPTMLFDLSHYPANAGETWSLWLVHPWVWGISAAIGASAAALVSWKSERHARFAAGAAMLLAAPRLYIDYVTFLFPAIPREQRFK